METTNLMSINKVLENIITRIDHLEDLIDDLTKHMERLEEANKKFDILDINIQIKIDRLDEQLKDNDAGLYDLKRDFEKYRAILLDLL